MNLIVRSKSGGCNVAKHFIDNWVKNDNLHPKANDVGFKVHTAQNFDEIILVDEGRILMHLKGNEALRLDRLQSFIINR